MNSTDHFTLLDFSIILIILTIANIPLIYRFKIKFEEALPTTISLIVIWLYFFGLVGYLKMGFYGLLVVVSAVSLACLSFSNGFKNIIRNTLTPGFFIYIVWLLVVFLAYSTQGLTHHDDFSHWGLANKNTYILDAIAVGSRANTAFQDYPPGTALFSYFLLKVKGAFSDPVSLFGMSIWGYAVITYPVKYLEWKNYKSLVIYGLLGFFIPVAFSIDQNSPMDYHAYLMVDYLHALIFGYALILATNINDKYTLFDVVKLIAVVFVLVLIKHAGIFLAIIILTLALYNVNLVFRLSPATTSTNFSLLRVGRGSVLLAGIALSFLAAYVSWKIFLNLNQVAEANVIHNYSALVTQFFSLNFDFPKRSPKVLEIYLDALYRISVTSGPVKVSFVGFCSLIIFGIYIAFKSMKEKGSQYLLLGNSIIIFAFLTIYLVAHSMLYLAVFSDGEAYGLSSFLRYLMYFTVGLFILILGSSMKYGVAGNNNYKYIFYFFSLLLVLNIGNYRKADDGPGLDEMKMEVVQKLKANVKSPDKYYSKWAQLELQKIGEGRFENTIDMGVIDTLQRIKAINDGRLLEEKMRLLESMATDNISLYGPGKSLCFFEGRGGASYGFALMLRNKLAPVPMDRILSYDSRTATEKAWHDGLFIRAVKNCGQLVLVEPNEVIEKNYTSFFSSPLRNFGLYDISWVDEKHIQLKLRDCRACD
jgi:hypothetical protein